MSHVRSATPAIGLDLGVLQQCHRILKHVSDGLMVIAAALEPRSDDNRQLGADVARRLVRFCDHLATECGDVRSRLDRKDGCE